MLLFVCPIKRLAALNVEKISKKCLWVVGEMCIFAALKNERRLVNLL